MPDDPAFMAALNGAMLELTYPWNWEQFGALTPDEMAQEFINVYGEFADSVCIEPDDLIYPKQFHTFGQVGKVIAGNTLIGVALAGALYGGYTKMTTPAISQEWEIEVLLAKGIWNFWYMCISNNSSADIRFRLNGANTTNINSWYSSGQVLNIVQPINADQTILTDGIHTVGFKAETKQAASSNYNMWIQAVWGKWKQALP